jgi:hypothetical protein
MKKLCGFFAFLVLIIGIGIAAPQTVEAKSSSTYYIKVNRQQNCITIYKKDSKGNYTIPVKAMACSTGLTGVTPLGTFSMGQQYRWHLLDGGVYGQYCSRIYGGVLFHSVFYHGTDNSKLYYNAYNKLGSAASHGCVRLTVADAKWIYDNCAPGTKITIYNSSNPGPLGKPSTVKIDTTNTTLRGWDPTDPDTKNPWRKLKPTISGIKDKTVERLSVVNLKKGVTATDYKGKTLKVTVSGKVNAKKIGKYKIKYTAKDSIGNETTKTITITVKDTKKPKIKAAKKTLKFTEALSETKLIKELKTNFTATDSGEALSSKYITINATKLIAAMESETYGTYEVKAYAKDKAGNKSSTVTIKVKYVNPNPTPDDTESGTENGTENGTETGTETGTESGTETGTETATEASTQ